MKKMTVSIICLALLCAWVFVPVRAEDTPPLGRFEVANQIVAESKHGLEIEGSIPVFSFADKAFESELNAGVQREYKAALSQASGKQGKISFSYEIFNSENFVSVLLNIVSTVGAGTDIVRSFNFDVETCEFITISTVLGPNGLKILNRQLQNEVKGNIDKYNAAVAEVTDDHAFYADGDVFYAVFDKYEIAYGFVGVVRFPVEMKKIVEVRVEEYYVKTGFNTKMVQLKEATDAFGMALEWDEKSGGVSVFLPGGEFAAQVFIGKTSYLKGKAALQLETEPELKDGRTQVPVSFLGDALGISYSFEGREKQTIVLSYYVE